MTLPQEVTPWLSPKASEHMQAMARAALRAGVGLQQAFKTRDTLNISQKSKGDFVSDADRTAEAEINLHLTATYPKYGWLGEETGTRAGIGTALRWVVDPLDGTTNFLKGIPHWAISIALCDGDDILAALIYDPQKAEMFTAERSCGAFLNGRQISVSGEGDLTAALFATGVPAGGRVTYLKSALQDLERLMPECAGIRRNGAAALDLAYVAAGRLEGYWERNLDPWDIAAGILLVQEAKGVVQPLWPDQDIFSSGSFLASNAALANTFRKFIV